MTDFGGGGNTLEEKKGGKSATGNTGSGGLGLQVCRGLVFLAAVEVKNTML